MAVWLLAFPPDCSAGDVTVEPRPASASGSNSSAAVRVAGADLAPDCALARKEHPRLLFTKADLPAIRARIAKPGLKPIYERMKKTVDEQLAQGPGRVQAAGRREDARAAGAACITSPARRSTARPAAT